ncbi:MAG: pseudouridine-5'-phosphate glycosidase [Rhodobacteraceae bacterium]|nr:pseudouridine-5'-phosphate glycosidase [Paracoccaceae bacterium]
MFALTYSDEIHEARARGLPMVALESTIITHGMPFPQSVETARKVEAEIRAHGAVPATIAVLDGNLHIGLSDTALNDLAQRKDVAKLSRADLAVCMAAGGTGATTVAATICGSNLDRDWLGRRRALCGASGS